MDELFDIDQISDDFGIDLDADEFGLTIIDIREQEGFQYPAMLISGMKFNDTMRVLQSIYRKSERAFDVWIDLEDGNPPVKRGMLPADSRTFLTMRYLGLDVTLYLNEDYIEKLNLKDPNVIERFI